MQRILTFCEISQIVTDKNANKSTFKASGQTGLRKNKGKFAYRISGFKRKKTAPKLFQSLVRPTICLNLLVLSLILYKCLHFLKILQYLNVFINKTYKTILKVHLVRLLLLCYSTQGGTGGVSFANKNVSGLQKYLRFQNEYNKVEIELRVVITRLISVQIAFHSVQLPLFICRDNLTL